MTMPMTDIVQPPRDDLIRMVSRDRARLELREDDADQGLTLVGYAAVFNEWTEIDDLWEGHFRERFLPGAFKRTLRTQGDRVKVLFNHGFDPSIGDKPLGKPSILREDSTGLWVEVPLDDTSYNRDLAALLRSGALDGQSIRFRSIKESWDRETKDKVPERSISEAGLAELGPVTFPAYEATTAGIRSAAAYRVWREARRSEPAGTSDEPEATVPPAPGLTSPEPAGTSALHAAEARARHLDLIREPGLRVGR